jgi:hypothetical protein
VPDRRSCRAQLWAVAQASRATRTAQASRSSSRPARGGGGASRRSVGDLQAASNRYLDEANHDPKPFIWTADANKIIAAVNRGRQALESIL